VFAHAAVGYESAAARQYKRERVPAGYAQDTITIGTGLPGDLEVTGQFSPFSPFPQSEFALGRQLRFGLGSPQKL
jgi:hypothetical protein